MRVPAACTSRKKLPISIELEVGWTTEIGRFGDYINPLPLTGIKPRSLGLSGRIVVTVPITQSVSCAVRLSKIFCSFRALSITDSRQ